jgi:hypothetical protein
MKVRFTDNVILIHKGDNARATVDGEDYTILSSTSRRELLGSRSGAIYRLRPPSAEEYAFHRNEWGARPPMWALERVGAE